MNKFSKSVKRILIPALIMACAQPDLFAQATDSLLLAKSSVKDISQIKVQGIIKDASTGKGIPGISVSVPGFSATITDDSGAFKVSVPNLQTTLVSSGSGYQRKEMPVKGRTRVEISLYEDSYTSFYDIVTLPYNTVPQTQTPYAVSYINTGGAWNRPTETPDSYLQGKAAGLDVTRRSGTPGIGADLLLRGYSSLYATNQPLIVVDGIIYDNQSFGTSLISGFQNNRLGNVDIKDIDNITILKDGGSLYGTKGANGVILITTGRAKDVATRLDFSAYGGVNSTVRELPVMDAGTYRLYLADVMKTKAGFDNTTFQNQPYMIDSFTIGYYNYHQNTNWQDKVMASGNTQNYYLKVSGGDNIATYALSMGYLKNDGLIDNTDLTRYQTRFNANLNLSTRLKAQANLAFTRAEQNVSNIGFQKNTNPIYLSLVKAPFFSPYVVSDLNLASPNLSEADVFSVSNPLAAATTVLALDRSYRFVGSVGFEYALAKSFSIQSINGVTFDKARTNTFVPNIGIATSILNTAEAKNQSGATVQRLFSVYTDNRLAYNHKINRNQSLDAYLGFRFSNNKSESDYALSYNSASDEFVTLQSGSSLLRRTGGNLGDWNWLDNYLNLNYSAYNKYFLSFNLAADASSRFGKDIDGALSINGNKFAILPSVSAAWLLSSESFMPSTNFLEMLKLRASYTVAGNDDIGNYSAKKTYATQSFLGRQGLVQNNVGNSQLKWETIEKLNSGFDAGLLHERLNLSFDIFRHNTSDMLVQQPLLSATGFSSILTNSGAMKTTGAELNVQARIINHGKFKWDAAVNLTHFKNEVTKLPSTFYTISGMGATTISRVGDAPNLFFGYKTNGVYSSDAEAANVWNKLSDGSIVPFQGGDIKFVNTFNSEEDIKAGRIVIDENDKQVIGNPNPDVVGGFNNSLTYKRWSLSTLFTFSLGNDVYNGTRAGLESMSGAENQTPAAVNRWQHQGQVTNMPRAVWGDPSENSRFADRWIENGSYLRLRTVSVSYDLPVKMNFVKSATVYGIANNLFTLTNYLGYDPEMSVSSSPFARGIDSYYVPQYSSFQLGVRVGL